jgi:hypothetical protein
MRIINIRNKRREEWRRGYMKRVERRNNKD